MVDGVPSIQDLGPTYYLTECAPISRTGLPAKGGAVEGPAMDKSASQSLGLVDFTMAGLERATGADLTPGAKPSLSTHGALAGSWLVVDSLGREDFGLC